VDLDAVRTFLAGHHRAVLATKRSDGSPQLSPIAVGVDDRGYAVISTRETAMKTRNIRRDPAVTVCVLTDEWYGEWLWFSGSADILSLPEAMEPLVSYYRGVAGEHPDWDDYRAAMERERRVLLRITIEAAGPDVSG
jgi:PPOX class probable F420-dependent enzyme